MVLFSFSPFSVFLFLAENEDGLAIFNKYNKAKGPIYFKVSPIQHRPRIGLGFPPTSINVRDSFANPSGAQICSSKQCSRSMRFLPSVVIFSISFNLFLVDFFLLVIVVFVGLRHGFCCDDYKNSSF